MAKIFVSYDREDTDFSEVVQAKLQKAGHETFMDLELLNAGDDWRDKIDQALRRSQALVVIMTPEAAASLYVTYEWSFALGAGVTVIPLELRPTLFHPRLDVLQRLDFTNKARPWEKLLSEIEKTIAASPPCTVQVAETAPPAVKRAVAALDHLDAEEQQLAIENLAQMDHPEAKAALSQALDHPNKAIRIAAAFHYPDRKDPRILAGMFEAYRDRQLEEIWYKGRWPGVEDTVKKMGTAAVPLLLALLQSDCSRIRSRAATALGCLKNSQTIEPLTRALSDTSEPVRIEATKALGEIGNETVAKNLRPLLQDDSEQVRLAAVDALGKLRDKEALPDLQRLLLEDRSQIRGAAALALGNIGDAAALPALLQSLKDHAIWEKVIQALGILGNPAAIPELRQILTANEDDIYQSTRYAAALALIRLRDVDSLSTIVDLVKSFRSGIPPTEVVLAMSDLGEIATAGLIDILNHGKSRQEQAAQSLRRIGTEAALAAVKKWEYAR